MNEEKVNFREKALCSACILNRNFEVYCVPEKLFLSPVLLHFSDSSENRIAYFLEKKKKKEKDNISVFWQHLGLSGYQILLTNHYKLCVLQQHKNFMYKYTVRLSLKYMSFL